MQWEKLTVDDFAQAMEQTKGVSLPKCPFKHLGND